MYSLPEMKRPARVKPGEAILVASGDLRLSANQKGWQAQSETQRQGMDVFANIDPDAPLIVVESVWQYSHHVLAGLRTHRGPILTVANWSGQWPGLVGMLNLNGSLTKMGVKYSSIWSENFDDEYFLAGLARWLKTGVTTHRTPHVRAYAKAT